MKTYMRVRPRALVVDDDEVLASLMARHLSDAGLEVRSALRPREAFVAFLSAGPFDLLVLDVQMPEMSGPDLADAMRDPGVDQRVLFVSGGERPPRLGPRRRFLPKPFTAEALISEVRGLLEER